MNRLFAAALGGFFYTLIIWGIMTLFGSPTWSHHHMMDFLCWVGLVYACGVWSGIDTGRKDAKR